MVKIKAKLRSMDLRGETTTTRWGDVSFSREGLAELEVDEEDLPLLRALKWLVEAPAQSQEAPEADPLPPEPETPAPPAETPPAETFDTSDEVVVDPPEPEPSKPEPDHGGKKSGKSRR